MSRSTLKVQGTNWDMALQCEDGAADPSNTASPKGLVLLLPPRNRSQIVSAKSSAWVSLANPTCPVSPPREMVTIFPLDWQVWTSEARAEQSVSCVPGKVLLSNWLQVYWSSSEFVLWVYVGKCISRSRSRWRVHRLRQRKYRGKPKVMRRLCHPDSKTKEVAAAHYTFRIILCNEDEIVTWSPAESWPQ